MLVYFTIILIVLLGFCGLAVDIGRMEVRTAQLQAAADAGAMAAAGELLHGGTGSNPTTAATNDVNSMLTLNNLPAATSISESMTAVNGPYASDYSTVEVDVTQNFPNLFLGLVTKANASITLSVSAVAEVPPCVVLLANPAVNNGFSNNYWDLQVASNSLSAPTYSCPIYSKSGVFVDGFANVNGSQLRSSAPSSATVISGWTVVAPIYNAPVISDPLAYVTAPSPGTCKNSSPLSYNNPSSLALTPGTYCGKTVSGTTTPALTVTGTYTTGQGAHCTSNPTISLSAGLYIFEGGVSFNCLTVTGTGVTIYLTHSSSVGFGVFNLTSSTWNVSAPTSSSGGSIAGIVLMNDRSWSGGNEDFSIMYSTWRGDGVIYANNTGIYDYETPMSAPNYLNIVAANIYTYNGTLSPSVNYASLPAGNPLQTVISLVQ